MNQEDSEDEDELEDNVIDDDDVTYQATNEPEIITDIPVNWTAVNQTGLN